MALVRQAVELYEVVAILRRRGYGEVSNRKFGILLNKDTGKRFQSGGEIRETIGGLSHEQLRQILLHAETPEQAANAVEGAILGKDMLPVDSVKAQPAGTGMTSEVVERMVTNRVASEVAKIVAPIQQQMNETLRDMKEVLNRVMSAPAPQQPKKRGRPPKIRPEQPATYADLATRSSQVPPDAV